MSHKVVHTNETVTSLHIRDTDSQVSFHVRNDGEIVVESSDECGYHTFTLLEKPDADALREFLANG